MRGEDRPVALAFLDQQAILRQVLGAIHATTVTARSFSNDRFPGRWSFDRTRNETETVTTYNRAIG